MLQTAGRIKGTTALLGRLGDIGKVGRVAAPVLDATRSAGVRAVVEQRRSARLMESWGPAARRDFYSEIWAAAARANDAQCHPMVGDFLLLSKEGMETVVLYHTVMLDDPVSLLLAHDKVAVHELLGRAGLPTAAHLEVDVADRRAGWEFLRSLAGRPAVVKPARSTSGGEGVTCGVTGAEEFERARIWARRWGTRLLVEQQGDGQEFRFLFLDGKLLDVLRRGPPTVNGDGRSSVAQLLAAENARRAASGGRTGATAVTIDLDCLLTLDRAGWSLRSVPGDGVTVRAKSAANQGGAADSETVLPGEVGEALVADAATAAAVMGLRLAGIDLITPDPFRSLRDAGGLVIEVNGSPGLHYHYAVAEPDQATPVAVPLLAALLDPVRGRRSPACRRPPTG